MKVDILERKILNFTRHEKFHYVQTRVTGPNKIQISHLYFIRLDYLTNEV